MCSSRIARKPTMPSRMGESKMGYQAQEDYDKAYKDYGKAKEDFVKANTEYKLEWAKAWDMERVRNLSAGTRLSNESLKNKLLVQQSNPDTSIGRAFIKWGGLRAEKSNKYIDLDIAKRAYWEAKDDSM